MSDTELLWRPAVELAEFVRARKVSPVELVELSLAAIERVNPAVGAVVAVAGERALEAARAAERLVLDADGDLPPFTGVPTLIKDMHPATDLPIMFGARGLAGFVPPFDAEHVRRLRAAGFVFVGVSHMPEFGTTAHTETALHGICRNPWDLERSPGGSSGGAAAAVAAGMVPVADASDGAGSVRIPASTCGLFGLKPARGRVSNGPLFGDVLLGIVTPGPMARYTADAAAWLDAIAGYAPGDPHWAPPPARPFAEEAAREPGRLRIGVMTASPLPHRTVGAEVVRETEAFARLLESLGHQVEPCVLPVQEQIEETFTVVWTAGLAANPLPPEVLEPFNQALAAKGRAASAPALLQAFTSLQLQCRQIVAASLAYDVVLYPTLTSPPLRVGELAGMEPEAAYDAAASFVGFTPIANLTGQPAVSMPVGWSDEGLPIGVSALGRPGDEATLLRLAAQAEAATGWTERRPGRALRDPGRQQDEPQTS